MQSQGNIAPRPSEQQSLGGSGHQGPMRVVVIGAGFGGLSAAKALAHMPVALTIIDQRNHHLFQPLLYQVATAGLSPADIATPIRSLFSGRRNVRVLLGRVTAIGAQKREVALDDKRIPYDTLIVATGARHAYFGHGGQVPELWSACVARFLAGELPTVPPHETAALTLRFLCDDIKAMYSEAAQADGVPPSSRQIDAWFWSETIAGKLLIALRSMALQSENNALKTVGGRFFVPVPCLPPT